MAMKKQPGQHPREEDLNRIYGSRNVHRLAQAHKRLKRRFRPGDHIEHVHGIKDEEVSLWRAHMRALPDLPRTLLREAIDHALRATPPSPIHWVVKNPSRGHWSIAVTERRGRLTIEIVPPVTTSPLSRRKRRAT
ncbi:MAG TPA: hypothetical protein VMA53_12760 [Stellaceae bacterium]|nr:hypothetical protein [Stellaceae bacterium]